MTTAAITRVLDDPAASDWLKAALRASMERDAVDATRDAETLLRLLDDRLMKILMRFRK